MCLDLARLVHNAGCLGEGREKMEPRSNGGGGTDSEPSGGRGEDAALAAGSPTPVPGPAPTAGSSSGHTPAGSPQAPAPQQPTLAGSAIRVSDRERDDALRRLQNAFAEGRLGDDEFDARMHAALGSRTRADLDRLFGDLPAEDAARPAASSADWPPESPFAVAIKGSVRRGGRWRVPQRMTTLAYKGSSLLDVRAAELTSAVTTIRAFAYKSDVEIIVPPGVRVVVGGFGVSQDSPEDGQLDDLSQDAPVLHVRGFAYKGRIEIRARPGRL